ncbi:MAG: AI-2E family transporter [Candidatus Aminicenantes bacterium]|nr:AI-2E family transporter [Candidatus Aminicenantes bacterium]
MNKDNKAMTIAAWIVAAAVIGVVFKSTKAVLFPLFLALFIYFILAPVQDLLMKIKLSRNLSLVLIILITFVILYLMALLFYSSGKSFAADLPDYGNKLKEIVDKLKNSVELPGGGTFDPLAWADSLDITKIGTFVLNSLGTFVSFLSTIFLVLIFLIFMLAGRGKLNDKIRRFSPNSRHSARIIEVVEHIDRQVQKYLALKTVISLASGLIAMAIIMAFGVRYAILWGFITFILNYIPNIGSFIAKILPFGFAILQLGRFWPAVWMLAILIVTDAITGMIIEPRIMGKGLGLSPLAILIALFFWGWLWGIPGMILAVPIMVVMKIIASNFPSMRWLEGLLSK